jgi:hypothetical protein
MSARNRKVDLNGHEPKSNPNVSASRRSEEAGVKKIKIAMSVSLGQLNGVINNKPSNANYAFKVCK